MEKLYVNLDLGLFDGGGGAAGAGTGAEGGAAAAEGDANAAAAGTAPEAGAPAGEGEEAAPQKTPEERQAEFDRFIEDNKDLYEAQLKKNVGRRLRDTEKKVQAYDKLMPLMETFAGRYGVDANNADALIEAISNDNALYEEEAMQRGMSIDQLKAFKRMEAEVNMYRRAQQEQQRQAAAQQVYARWEQEAAQVKQFYPSFDLRAELSHPQTGERFRALLGARVDVKSAYEVIHQQEIISGVASRVADDTTAKVRNDIAARGQRPAEAGAAGTPGMKVDKINPANLTNAQLDEISRRVLAGERITF